MKQVKLAQIKPSSFSLTRLLRRATWSSLIATLVVPLSSTLPSSVAEASATRCAPVGINTTISECHYTNGSGTRINYETQTLYGGFGGVYVVVFTAVKDGQELARVTRTDTTLDSAGRFFVRVDWNTNFPDGTQLCTISSSNRICNEVQE